MKSNLLELSNRVSQNGHTQLILQVILMTYFSKNTSVANIFKWKNARKLEKSYFFLLIRDFKEIQIINGHLEFYYFLLFSCVYEFFLQQICFFYTILLI